MNVPAPRPSAVPDRRAFLLSWDVSEALYRDDLPEAFRLVLAELAATRTALAKLAAIAGERA